MEALSDEASIAQPEDARDVGREAGVARAVEDVSAGGEQVEVHDSMYHNLIVEQ